MKLSPTVYKIWYVPAEILPSLPFTNNNGKATQKNQPTFTHALLVPLFVILPLKLIIWLESLILKLPIWISPGIPNIELFFKWIKQNLKIKKFLGKSENAIRTQICIALISFVLLRMAEELKEVCREITSKNLLKIIGNSLFNCLKLRDYGRKRYKNPNQLQFEWVLNL